MEFYQKLTRSHRKLELLRKLSADKSIPQINLFQNRRAFSQLFLRNRFHVKNNHIWPFNRNMVLVVKFCSFSLTNLRVIGAMNFKHEFFKRYLIIAIRSLFFPTQQTRKNVINTSHMFQVWRNFSINEITTRMKKFSEKKKNIQTSTFVSSFIHNRFRWRNISIPVRGKKIRKNSTIYKNDA